MSPIKEPCYFASEIRPENFAEEFQERVGREANALQEYLNGPMDEKRFGGPVLEWEQHVRLFQNVAGQEAIGEASVCYLWSATAPRAILSRVPDAKILMILRNPAERAFSQYLHMVTNGLIRTSFREQVQASLRRKNDKFGTLYPFLEFGLYYEQVKRYLNSFPKENVRIDFFEDYRKQPAEMVAAICSFLGVDSSFALDTSQKHLEPRVPRSLGVSDLLKKYGIWQRVKEFSPPALRSLLRTLAFRPRRTLVMDPADKAYLADYYREDTGKLAGLLDRDLSHWLHS